MTCLLSFSTVMFLHKNINILDTHTHIHTHVRRTLIFLIINRNIFICMCLICCKEVDSFHNEFPYILVPAKQTDPYESFTLCSNSTWTNGNIWINCFLCFPIPCKQKARSNNEFYAFIERAHLINEFLYILIRCKQTCKLNSWFQCAFQFYANRQTHMNALHLIYLNSMRTNNTSMNFSVFQFHVNKQAHMTMNSIASKQPHLNP